MFKARSVEKGETITKEQKFLNTLRDIFIGVKVEGTGGFINLMKIKSKYYEKIEKLLKEDMDKASKISYIQGRTF
ncbi:MAG: hypothetical protein N2Z80_03295 [Hydrogenothermaceae bacterium]|nr:hypothetical protein [Hydrogenothermaceae bacterium]